MILWYIIIRCRHAIKWFEAWFKGWFEDWKEGCLISLNPKHSVYQITNESIPCRVFFFLPQEKHAFAQIPLSYQWMSIINQIQQEIIEKIPRTLHDSRFSCCGFCIFISCWNLPTISCVYTNSSVDQKHAWLRLILSINNRINNKIFYAVSVTIAYKDIYLFIALKHVLCIIPLAKIRAVWSY